MASEELLAELEMVRAVLDDDLLWDEPAAEGTILVRVVVPEGGLQLQAGGGAVVLEHLPPLELGFRCAASYPAAQPPAIRLRCAWQVPSFHGVLLPPMPSRNDPLACPI